MKIECYKVLKINKMIMVWNIKIIIGKDNTL